MNFDSKSFLNNVGEGAGIYQMLDADGVILYVGKAKNLKKRLTSYFRKSSLPTKTAVMMLKVADVQVIVTHTENEALILESNLIKKHKPRYNILLRDSKSYPFIHIDTDHDFPGIRVFRGKRNQPGQYFGPYPSATAVRETLSLVQKVLPVRQCDDVFYSNRARPCLQYQIKRCSAPCVGLISKKLYHQDVALTVMFLQGKDQSLNKMLIRKMELAASNHNYEEAANWRDRINALKRVQSHQSITSGHSDIDIITVAHSQAKYCVEVTFIRGGRHTGSNGYFPLVALDVSLADVLRAFIMQYYHKRPAPGQIIVGEKLSQQAQLSAWLSEQASKKVALQHNVRGDRKNWLSMAQLNVVQRLKRHLSESQNASQRLQSLATVFDFPNPLQRVECFDISHTQGKQTVASCVVFSSEGAVKSDYRRYNIKEITPGDDYAAMRQAIYRRYKRVLKEQAKMPDILFIDGGKGQLSSATEVMAELEIVDVLLVGVAKGEGRKPGLETLFVNGQSKGIKLAMDSPAFHLIQQIRDEAHRFAITGHRARRRKAQTKSILEEISGIGQKRRLVVLKHFGGLQGLKQAGVKDIAQVPGISDDLATKIYLYLQDN